MKNVVILIPAYNPSKKLLQLLDELTEANFEKIIVVNGGSKENKKIFEKVREYKNVVLLEYKENKGKGYALKYGINYYLENFTKEYRGIVTCDADLQHSVEDITNVALKLLGNQDSLILGYRDFNLKQVPFASKFGNKLTSFLFKYLYGKTIKDTQTGLRAIPNRYLNLSLEASGNKFDYEMNILIKFVKEKINIVEVPISTIYFKKSESKFNRISDSILIYRALLNEFIKCGLTSLCAAVIDLIVFTFFINTFNTLDNNLAIILGTIIARIISAFINFNLTKYFVFDSHEKSEKMLVKFYLHNACNMVASALLVMFFHHLLPMIHESYLKMLVDIIIYLIGYKIQKHWIFKA